MEYFGDVRIIQSIKGVLMLEKRKLDWEELELINIDYNYLINIDYNYLIESGVIDEIVNEVIEDNNKAKEIINGLNNIEEKLYCNNL